MRTRGFRHRPLSIGSSSEALVATPKRKAVRRRRSPSTSHRCVDEFLRQVGIGPRMIADNFWDSLRATYGEHAERFLDYVDRRRTAARAEATYLQDVETLYRLKNASPEFSVAVSSQYVGRLYSRFLAVVSSLGLDRQAKRILDLGCDNGILTAFYAKHFPNAAVLGIDLCPEAVACANALKDRLQISNLAFKVADAFQQPAPDELPPQSWDVVFMTLSGYEELDRHPEAGTAMATHFLNFLTPTGVGIVVEYPDSTLMHYLRVHGGRCRSWSLSYEAFGGNELCVDIAEMQRRPEP